MQTDQFIVRQEFEFRVLSLCVCQTGLVCTEHCQTELVCTEHCQTGLVCTEHCQTDSMCTEHCQTGLVCSEHCQTGILLSMLRLKPHCSSGTCSRLLTSPNPA